MGNPLFKTQCEAINCNAYALRQSGYYHARIPHPNLTTQYEDFNPELRAPSRRTQRNDSDHLPRRNGRKSAA